MILVLTGFCDEERLKWRSGSLSRLSVRERLHEARNNAILDAAHDLLLQRGYAAMSMDELAAHLGVSKATLYHHYPSKEELALAVVLRTMRAVGDEISATAMPGVPAVVQLERVLRNAFKRRADLWAAQVLLPDGLRRDPRFRKQQARLLAAVEAIVNRGKAEKDINPHLSTPIIVHTIQQLFQAKYGELLASVKCSQDDLVDTLLHLLFNGIATDQLHKRATGLGKENQ
jgi:AcrR family transcriptional regulator